MAMAAGKPPPLPSRAYISVPRAPPHHPSPTSKLPRLPVPSPPLPPSWSAGRRAIAAARAPSSSVKLPNLSPSLLLRIGSLHVYLFESVGSLAPPTELSAADLDFRPPAPISIVAAFPAALSLAEASTCGEKLLLASLFNSLEPHTAPPLAGRRPFAPMDVVPRQPPTPPVQAHV
jgi:hypothetical protein